MKANKALKRLAKIEALISDVTERYSATAAQTRDLLQYAKAAVIRAREAVQASSERAKDRPVKHSQGISRLTAEHSKPKRKLSAAGRKAISEATNNRRATQKATAKPKPAVAKKVTAKKSVTKKVAPLKAAPVKAAKPYARKVAKKSPAKKAQVKAPAKKAVKVVRSAKTPAAPTIAVTDVETPEEVMQEAAVQEVGATAVETQKRTVPEKPVL